MWKWKWRAGEKGEGLKVLQRNLNPHIRSVWSHMHPTKIIRAAVTYAGIYIYVAIVNNKQYYMLCEGARYMSQVINLNYLLIPSNFTK